MIDHIIDFSKDVYDWVVKAIWYALLAVVAWFLWFFLLLAIALTLKFIF